MLLEAISKAYSGDQMALDRDRPLDALDRDRLHIKLNTHFVKGIDI
jgi:hypothetical protein